MEGAFEGRFFTPSVVHISNGGAGTPTEVDGRSAQGTSTTAATTDSLAGAHITQARSGGECLALLGAFHAGVGAVLALFVFGFVFAAFFLAGQAGFLSEFGHDFEGLRTLGSQGLQRGANDDGLVNRFAATQHLLLATGQ